MLQKMCLSGFNKQPRGPALFDTWLWEFSVETVLGSLPVELYCDIDFLPNEAMVNLSSELAAFTQTHDTLLLDIVYGHYKHAEANDWLHYWNVPTALTRTEVLTQVEAIILNVHADLFASVHINPRWDPEHKLCLTFEGMITEINGAPFLLKNGVLTLQ